MHKQSKGKNIIVANIDENFLVEISNRLQRNGFVIDPASTNILPDDYGIYPEHGQIILRKNDVTVYLTPFFEEAKKGVSRPNLVLVFLSGVLNERLGQGRSGFQLEHFPIRLAYTQSYESSLNIL